MHQTDSALNTDVSVAEQNTCEEYIDKNPSDCI